MSTYGVLAEPPGNTLDEFVKEAYRRALSVPQTSASAIVSKEMQRWIHEIDQAQSGRGEQPIWRARENARAVLLHLDALRFWPDRIAASADGGIAFVFEIPGRYADIECFNDGSIMLGLTDFEDYSEVFDFQLGRDHVEAAHGRICEFLGRQRAI